MEPKNIECKVVKELMSQESRGGANRLRVVRWIVDGKDTGALLEKRNFYMSKGGEEKMGKAKGLNHADVSFIVDNWKEIEPLLSKES
ncbi:MAG: hypothetical protein JO102_03515 [Elusimicrobia bacterium]|nr:hypothetical protein [Elusimicrobiota bacterium]